MCIWTSSPTAGKWRLWHTCQRVHSGVLGLTEREKCHAFGLAKTPLLIPGQILRGLNPEGSHERRRLQPHSVAAYAEAQAPPPEQPMQVEDDGKLLAASLETLTDDAIDYATSADPELARALGTLRQDHAKLHQLK